jgi:MFS transporter, DHA1 family, tetracycline resistance protein
MTSERDALLSNRTTTITTTITGVSTSSCESLNDTNTNVNENGPGSLLMHDNGKQHQYQEYPDQQIGPVQATTRQNNNHRKSFLDRIWNDSTNNKATVMPKLVLMSFLLAMSMGSTLGIVPKIMTERYAQVNYGVENGTCLNDNTNATTTTPPRTAITTITSNTAATTANHESFCLLASQDAQNSAAISDLFSNLLTLVCSSWMGALSDIHGRQFVLIIGIFLSSLSCIALLWTVLQPNLDPLWYYITKSANGIVHWMVMALSIVTDCLEEDKRAAGVGLLLAGFWLGLCIGPTMAMIYSSYPIVVVVIVSCLFQGMGLLLAICWIPETLSPDEAHVALQKQQQQQLQERTVLEQQQKQPNNVKRCYNVIHPSLLKYGGRMMIRPIRELAILNRNQILRLLAILAFFSGMATSGDQTLLLYYVDTVLHFDATDIAIMFLLVGATTLIAQTILLPPLHRGIGERGVLLLCFGTATLSNVMYGLAWDRQVMYIAMCIGALASMAFPTISAMKANHVEASERGRIQGALYSIQAVSAGIGPVAMRIVDATVLTTLHYRRGGSMFFFAAVLQCIAFVGAFHLPPKQASQQHTTTK